MEYIFVLIVLLFNAVSIKKVVDDVNVTLFDGDHKRSDSVHIACPFVVLGLHQKLDHLLVVVLGGDEQRGCSLRFLLCMILAITITRILFKTGFSFGKLETFIVLAQCKCGLYVF